MLPWIRKMGRRATFAFVALAFLGGTTPFPIAAAARASAPLGPAMLGPRVSMLSTRIRLESRLVAPLAPGAPWQFGIVLPSRNPDALAAYAAAVENPASPLYHHFLRHRTMFSRFGPSFGLARRLGAVLSHAHLSARRYGGELLVTGTVGAVDALFHTHLVTFVRSSRRFEAPDSSLLVPTALRSAVGLTGLVRGSLVSPSAGPRPIQVAHTVRVSPTPRPPFSRPAAVMPASSDPLSVTATLLSPQDRAPGMAVRYLLTASYDGSADSTATVSSLSGTAPATVTYNVSGTTPGGTMLLDLTVPDPGVVSLTATVTDAAGEKATVSLPSATFAGMAARTCDASSLPSSGQAPGTILCPFNPASNPVGDVLDAAAVQTLATGTAHPAIAIYTIADVASEAEGDLTDFVQAFGLALPSVSVDYQSSNVCTASLCTATDMASYESELALDLQMAETAAPGATLEIYEDESLRDALNAVVTQDTADVFSVSYGAGEDLAGSAVMAGWDTLAEEATTEGITLVVAAGDSGAYAGAQEGNDAPMPSYPATSPYVTAVGGTEVSVSLAGSPNVVALWGGDLGSELSPTALQSLVNQANLLGGGGVSTLEPVPSYQAATVPAGTSGRLVPDLSLPASLLAPGFFVYVAGDPVQVGGTSAAAPLFAGYVADMSLALGRLGNVNGALYRWSQTDPALFTPVSYGQNGVYAATDSDNAATGLGELNVDALYADLAEGEESVAVSVTTTLAQAGEPVDVTVHVAEANGTPVQNHALSITTTGSLDPGDLSADTVTTDATGEAAFTYTDTRAGDHGAIVVTDLVTGLVGETPTLTVEAGAPQSVKASSLTPVSLSQGASAIFTFTVTDAYGNPEVNLPVVFSTTGTLPASGLGSTSGETGPNGAVSVTYTAGTQDGVGSIAASVSATLTGDGPEVTVGSITQTAAPGVLTVNLNGTETALALPAGLPALTTLRLSLTVMTGGEEVLLPSIEFYLTTNGVAVLGSPPAGAITVPLPSDLPVGAPTAMTASFGRADGAEQASEALPASDLSTDGIAFDAPDTLPAGTYQVTVVLEYANGQFYTAGPVSYTEP